MRVKVASVVHVKLKLWKEGRHARSIWIRERRDRKRLCVDLSSLSALRKGSGGF